MQNLQENALFECNFNRQKQKNAEKLTKSQFLVSNHTHRSRVSRVTSVIKDLDVEVFGYTLKRGEQNAHLYFYIFFVPFPLVNKKTFVYLQQKPNILREY